MIVHLLTPFLSKQGLQALRNVALLQHMGQEDLAAEGVGYPRILFSFHEFYWDGHNVFGGYRMRSVIESSFELSFAIDTPSF